MGRSFYPAASAPVIEDWTAQNRFYHAASDRWYEMTRRQGRLWVGRYRLDPAGRRIQPLEREAHYIMGSGARARSYLHRYPDGGMIELPVAWYSQEKRWGMAPGYDRPNHPDFSRAITHKCMFCHNAYPNVAPGADRQGFDENPRFPAPVPHGIDCGRCHGAGPDHATLVNPARLPPDRQLDVCQQCHLETTTFRLPDSYRRFGRGFYSYRPGQPLSEYIVHFDHAAGRGWEDKFEIVSAAYRLRQSACFLRSNGGLTCTTCHDPHNARLRPACASCHPGAHRAAEDCASCHMPKRRTEDVVHIVMTDHRIQRGPPPADLLAPRPEKTDAEQAYRSPVVLYQSLDDPLRDVYLGIAQVKEKANLSAGVELLTRALARARPPYPEPWFELAEAQAALGRREAALQSYRRALEADAGFVQAHNNLANLLAAMGRRREALNHYRRALRIDPGSAVTHTNLGLTLVELGDRAAAETSFRQAIFVNPDYAEARLNLGALLLGRGRLGEARMELEKALELDPANAKARGNLDLLAR